ncbi:MAG: hypothetical protein ACYCZT_10195 [Thiobacillus sp.]
MPVSGTASRHPFAINLARRNSIDQAREQGHDAKHHELAAQGQFARGEHRQKTEDDDTHGRMAAGEAERDRAIVQRQRSRQTESRFER